MKIFAALQVQGPKELLLQQELIQELKRVHVSVLTPLDLKKSGFEGKSFDEIDALIIDGGSQDPEVGYLLAIGLANKKRVLYLLQRGSMIDPSVDALTKNQEVKKYIKIVFYTPENLIRKVKAFLQYLDQSIGKELFSIKYTLRLSPRLDRYIVWKSNQTKKSKADFLRDWLKDVMEKDSDYQNRLQ